MPSETTPLLSGGLTFPLPITTSARSVLPVRPPRVHFLDNLRGVLICLVVFHHAAVNILERTVFDEVDENTKRSRSRLSTFTLANIQFLWPTFFLVSGWAARLALDEKSSSKGYEYKFVRKRVVCTLFPALVHLVVGRWLIVRLVGVEAFLSRSSGPLWTPYAQLTGPAPYIIALVILDAGYAIFRFLARKTPPIPRRDMDVVFKVIAIMAAISLTLHASALYNLHAMLIPRVYYVLFPGDSPGYGAPTTLVIAYAAGVNGPILQLQVLIPRWKIAAPALLLSLTFAYFPYPFRGVLKNIAPYLPGGNAVYYIIVFFTVPWSLLSLFSSILWLRSQWPTSWVSWAWLVAYIHVVPTIVAMHLLQTFEVLDVPLELRLLISGLIGAIVSWALVALVAKIWRWTKWIRRGGRLSMILITRRL